MSALGAGEDDKAGGPELPAPGDQVDEEAALRQLLGFDGFGTTKLKPVADNHESAAKGACQKRMKRTYRQYMNRRGGFNRPLDKE